MNNCFPETVVVYRDGVSDSQMDTVAKHEGIYIFTRAVASGGLGGLISHSSIKIVLTLCLNEM